MGGGAVLAWARLDVRRRWRSLAVLAVLVAVSAATVMTAVSGAHRGSTALDRLLERTLPATAQVAPSTPDFDWTPIAKLPYVMAVSPYRMAFEPLLVGDFPPDVIDLPPEQDTIMRTIERPVVLDGRLSDPTRADEAVITSRFESTYHVHVGDVVTLALPTRQQIEDNFDTTLPVAELLGPRLPIRVVGVVRTPWLDLPGQTGRISFTPALLREHLHEMIGDHGEWVPANAILRLRHGEADLAHLQADLTRITGRADIEVINLPARYRAKQRALALEATWLLAFGLAALVAALFLVGQAILRASSGSADDLRTAAALGMTPRGLVASATVGPILSGVVGLVLAVPAVVLASSLFPIGGAAGLEPDPGMSVDWGVLVGGSLVTVLIVAGWSAGGAAATLALQRRRDPGQRSVVVDAGRRAGLPVPVVLGMRFALERGGGRSALPVVPALLGAVVGVVGVVSVGVFSAGLHDALGHPERFGQTWQAVTLLGFNDFDSTPAAPVEAGLRGLADVRAVDVVRYSVVTLARGHGSAAMWTVPTHGTHVVVVEGRLPRSADEVALAPTTLSQVGATVGGAVTLTGKSGEHRFRVVGVALVPTGTESHYDDGGWVTAAGYDSLFVGFGMHALFTTTRGSTASQVLAELAVAHPDLADVQKYSGSPHAMGMDNSSAVSQLRHVRLLPLALGAFLGLLALAAVGHALVTAVRRRTPDLAVARALGMTPRQVGSSILVQATVQAVVGLAFGIPVGLALGRAVWRRVAHDTPLAYVTPSAHLTLIYVVPLAVVAVAMIAALPARRAARLPVAAILRTE